ncbi:hypothetical protein DRP04_03960 [Archaeoglobales archaeon]|nr:MAG: hypothetical protein DRP04_03960 [Archaeoglobales archaeon]
MRYEFFIKIIYGGSHYTTMLFRIYHEERWEVENIFWKALEKKIGVSLTEYDEDIYKFFYAIGVAIFDEVIEDIMALVPARVRKKEKILRLLPTPDLFREILAKSIVVFVDVPHGEMPSETFFMVSFKSPDFDLYKTLKKGFTLPYLSITATSIPIKNNIDPIDLFMEYWKKVARVFGATEEPIPLVEKVVRGSSRTTYGLTFSSFNSALCGLYAAASLLFVSKIVHKLEIWDVDTLYSFVELLMDDEEFYNSLSFLQKILIRQNIFRDREKLREFIHQIIDLLKVTPPEKRVKLFLSMMAIV